MKQFYYNGKSYYFNSNTLEVTDTDEEISLERHILPDAKTYDDKQYIHIDFSNNCNQRCKYCFIDHKNIITQSVENVNTALQSIIPQVPSDKQMMLVFGNCSEIILHKKQLFEFLDGLQYTMKYIFSEVDFYSVDKFIEQFNETFSKISNFNISSIQELNWLLPKEEFKTCVDEYIKLNNIPMPEDIVSINYEYSSTWFLYWNTCKKIMYLFPELVKKRNLPFVNIMIFTNGTLLDQEFIDELGKYLWDGIHIKVSIDGPKEIHDSIRGEGTYDKVMKAVELINNDKRCVLHVAATVTNKVQDFYKYLRFFADNHCFDKTGIEMSIVRDNPDYWYTEDNINELYLKIDKLFEDISNDVEKGDFFILDRFRFSIFFEYFTAIVVKRRSFFKCKVGNRFFINPNGVLTNCFYNYKNNIVDNEINYLDTPLYIDDLHVDNDTDCKACWAKYICGGKCPAKIKDTKEIRIKCLYAKYVCEKSLQLYMLYTYKAHTNHAINFLANTSKFSDLIISNSEK